MTTDQVETCFKKAVELVKMETRNVPPELLSSSTIETLFIQLIQAEDEAEKGKAVSA